MPIEPYFHPGSDLSTLLDRRTVLADLAGSINVVWHGTQYPDRAVKLTCEAYSSGRLVGHANALTWSPDGPWGTPLKLTTNVERANDLPPNTGRRLWATVVLHLPAAAKFLGVRLDHFVYRRPVNGLALDKWDGLFLPELLARGYEDSGMVDGLRTWLRSYGPSDP